VAAPSHAAELAKLRVGTPALVNFTFLPLHVGQQKGFFAQQGLEIEIIGFQGGSRMNQGIVAGDVDMAISSATDMAFTLKGVPDIAVAATAGPPLFLTVIVPYNSTARGPDDLKGKKIAVTTDGSFTAWLMRRLMEEKHWGANGMTLVAVGASPAAYVAALKTHEVDAAVQAPALAFKLEEAREGRMLFPASEIVHAFIANAIFATDRTLHDHPDEVRRFIKGWFDTITFMRSHKAETVEIERSLANYDAEVADREYDTVMPMFLTKGVFDPTALKALQKSFVEMGLVQTPPDMSKLCTEAYLPKD
jgi:ABC-type nitrate/sulfonate/bicarbonate transport system substrate-binding protein